MRDIIGGPIANRGRDSFNMDGFHPNSLGYCELAREVYSALTPKRLGPKSPRPEGDTYVRTWSSGGAAHSQTACARLSK